MTKNKPRKNLGFTLIELLVVIAIIGFLATASIVAFNSARMKARDARRASDINQIRKALDLYADDHGGTYPTGSYSSPDFGTLATNPDFKKYMSKMPDDPLGTVSGPSIWRFYGYWSSANFISWGVGTGRLRREESGLFLWRERKRQL